MKLTYDEKGRLSEILGSGENGSFKEGELEFFTNYFNGLINTEKEVKIKALEEQKIKETEFYKQNTEVAKANAEVAKANAESAKANAESNAESVKAVAEANAESAKANAESAKANAESNASIAKSNAEASIASSNALVAFFTTVSVVALTTLALKKPEFFENEAQPQDPETAAKPSSLPEPDQSNQFDPDLRAEPSTNPDPFLVPVK